MQETAPKLVHVDLWDRIMHPRPPLVSVVVPTHNRPEMLDEAVASVRAQKSFSDYEIIIASNGESNPLLSRRVATKFGCRFIMLADANRSFARNIAIGAAHTGISTTASRQFAIVLPSFAI